MPTHPAIQNTLAFIGRILISLIFILSGLQKIINFPSAVGYIASAALPFPPLLAIIAIIFELGGGLMLLLGWHTKVGALLLLIFTLMASFAIHHFWTYPEAQMTIQMQSFLKNLAISGACLYIISFGPGAYSFDKLRLEKKTSQYENR